MKFHSILLVCVLLSGSVSHAAAQSAKPHKFTDYSLRVGEYQFGFTEVLLTPAARPHGDVYGTQICLGPLGSRRVPFSPTQGLVGCCVIVAGLVIVPIVLTVRLKRKRAT